MTDHQPAPGGAKPTATIETAGTYMTRVALSLRNMSATAMIELQEQRDAQIRAQALSEAKLGAQSVLSDPKFGVLGVEAFMRVSRAIEALAHADGQQPESESRS